jgi:hypothetical protein
MPCRHRRGATIYWTTIERIQVRIHARNGRFPPVPAGYQITFGLEPLARNLTTSAFAVLLMVAPCDEVFFHMHVKASLRSTIVTTCIIIRMIVLGWEKDRDYTLLCHHTLSS